MEKTKGFPAESLADIEQGLQISPKWLAAALAGCGIIYTIFFDRWPLPANWLQIAFVGASFYILAGFVWIAGQWRTQLGYWVAVLGSIGLSLWSSHLLQQPAYLIFMVVPLVLSVVIFGPLPALFTVIVQTAALWFLPAFSPIIPTTFVLPIICVLWLVLGIMSAGHYPRQQLLLWFWDHFRHTQHLLAEARQRKV
jgi:hypothetical protein